MWQRRGSRSPCRRRACTRCQCNVQPFRSEECVVACGRGCTPSRRHCYRESECAPPSNLIDVRFEQQLQPAGARSPLRGSPADRLAGRPARDESVDPRSLTSFQQRWVPAEAAGAAARQWHFLGCASTARSGCRRASGCGGILIRSDGRERQVRRRQGATGHASSRQAPSPTFSPRLTAFCVAVVVAVWSSGRRGVRLRRLCSADGKSFFGLPGFQAEAIGMRMGSGDESAPEGVSRPQAARAVSPRGRPLFLTMTVADRRPGGAFAAFPRRPRAAAGRKTRCGLLARLLGVREIPLGPGAAWALLPRFRAGARRQQRCVAGRQA